MTVVLWIIIGIYASYVAMIWIGLAAIKLDELCEKVNLFGPWHHSE